VPVLKNAKHERFAQGVSEGMSGADAYVWAGYASNAKAAAVSATRLLKDAKISARVAELLKRREDIEVKATEKAVNKLAISKERVLAELAKIAFADAGDYFDWGPDGVTVKCKSELTTDQRIVVSEVSQTVTEKGGTIRVKLHDKQAALVNLGKHLGIFREIHELTGKDGGPIETVDASPRDELARRIAGVAARLGEGKALNGADKSGS
jgi:phage terminase small subunit